MSPRPGSTPRLSDWLAVSRNETMTRRGMDWQRPYISIKHFWNCLWPSGQGWIKSIAIAIAIRLSALRASHPLPPGRLLGVKGCWRLSRHQCHSAAERILSIEKSCDLIGNRTHDFSASSIVPQPTTLPRAPVSYSGMKTNGRYLRTWRWVEYLEPTSKREKEWHEIGVNFIMSLIICRPSLRQRVLLT
jgi:hypothetical protein